MPKPKARWIARVEVNDPTYWALCAPTRPRGARLAAGSWSGAGQWSPPFLYLAALALSQSVSVAALIVIEGYDGAQPG